MGVYTIFDDYGEEHRSEKTAVGGNLDKVFPLGIEFDPDINAATLEDGTLVHKNSMYQGLPVDMTYLPSKVRWGGAKRELTDLQKTQSRFLLSQKMRDAIELLEPGIHQYQPVELVWADGSHAANYFWFNPCNRLSGMDRTHTTHKFNQNTQTWQRVSGGKYVVGLEKIKNSHIWVDKNLTSGSVFVSEDFKKSMNSAGVNGIGYNFFEPF